METTATKILENNGFSSEDANNLVYHKLDMLIRNMYMVEDHDLHLWEAYCIGGANRDLLMPIAVRDFGMLEVDSLLDEMTEKLEELAIMIPPPDIFTEYHILDEFRKLVIEKSKQRNLYQPTVTHLIRLAGKITTDISEEWKALEKNLLKLIKNETNPEKAYEHIVKKVGKPPCVLGVSLRKSLQDSLKKNKD